MSIYSYKVNGFKKTNQPKNIIEKDSSHFKDCIFLNPQFENHMSE